DHWGIVDLRLLRRVGADLSRRGARTNEQGERKKDAQLFHGPDDSIRHRQNQTAPRASLGRLSAPASLGIVPVATSGTNSKEGSTERAQQPNQICMAEYVSQVAEHIRREVHKVIVGQDSIIDQILICLFAEGHALLEGVPGTAKTLTVKTIARIIGAGFNRIQFTPDLMPSDITGTNVFNVATSEFTLRH